jgi:hypothetical protein
MIQNSSLESKANGLFDFSASVIKNRKLKLILQFGSLIMFILSFSILAIASYSFILATIISIGLIGLITSSLLSAKFYKWPLVLFLVIVLGIFFKRNHWPYSSILMALGTLFLGGVCIFNSNKYFSAFPGNTFLKWFGLMTGIIVVLFMSGLLFMNMHWSGSVRVILIYSGCFLFIFSVLAMVFTLPFSNYIVWSDVERHVFFNTIITPMVFILALFILVFVFPDTYNSLMGRGVFYPPWNQFDIKLFNLEGIPVI